MMRPTAAEKGVGLVAEADPGDPPRLCRSRPRLEVLINLIDNGIKFTPRMDRWS
jgi:signal transduction histidine kinase